MKVRITDGNVRTLHGEIWDSQVPALFLRAGPRRRTWGVRIGRRRQTLGHYPSLGIADARNAALKLVLNDGEREDDLRPAPSIREALKLYEERQRLLGKGLRSLPEKLRAIKVAVTDRMNDPLDSLDRTAIGSIQRLYLVAGKKAMANRVVAYLSSMMTWAVRERYLAYHPIRGGLFERAREQPRHRVLSDDEIKALWRAATASNRAVVANFGRAVQLMLLTGVRVGEARNADHGEIDGPWWLLPTERTKNTRPHLIYLTPRARLVVGEGQGLVFKGQDGAIAMSHRMVGDLTRRAGIAPFQLRDLRRTVATGLGRLGYLDEQIGRVLNHTPKGVTAIHYNVHSYREQKQEMWERWSDHVGQVIG